MGQGSCRVLVPLGAGLRLCVDHHELESFVFGFVFDSDLAYVAYRRSAEIDWSSVDSVYRWIPYGFADSRVSALVEVVVPSRNQDANGELVPDKNYTARDVFCAVPSAHQCCMADAVLYMRPPPRAGTEVRDPPPILQGAVDAYNVDLNGEGERDFSDIPKSGEICAWSSLQVDFAVIRDKCNKYSIDTPSLDAHVSSWHCTAEILLASFERNFCMRRQMVSGHLLARDMGSVA